ncbi:hypothetical protein OH491_12035 [Termitidicoccus mucosus]
MPRLRHVVRVLLSAQTALLFAVAGKIHAADAGPIRDSASELGLPFPPAWIAETGADARRDEARRLFLTLLERSIAKNSAAQERQLDKVEAQQKAVSRFTLFLFYAQACRASLIPADAPGAEKAARDRYINNARRALLAFATAARTDRKAQADQNEFSQATCVALYEELDKLRALGAEEKQTVHAALGDGAQAVLELKAERGSFNRAAYVALGLAETARVLPDDARAAAWRAFATDVWEVDWMRSRDTIEDARGYNGLWIYATFRLAESLGRLGDLRDPRVAAMFARFSGMVAPNGAMPDFGNCYWVHGLEHWVYAAERIGAFYKRADFLDNAARIARFLASHPELDLGEMEALADACRIIAPAAPPMPPRPRSVLTTRVTDYGDVLYDKLYLRTGESPDAAYVCVDLHDGGYHGHADGGSIALYTKGPHVLLHTLGRLEVFANQHQGVWSAQTADELLADGASQHRPGEWTRWLVNFRWPGTHMGGHTIDPARMRRIFFRLGDPEGFTGEGVLEVRDVIGVRPDGSTKLIHPGWSGSQRYSAKKPGERAFLGPADLGVADWSEFSHLLVSWKSNVPQAVEWMGFESAAFNGGPNKAGGLRARAGSRMLSARVNPDASVAGGGFTREMLDASGRRIRHSRELRLRDTDGALVVLDTFEFTEAGVYAFGPVWHAQAIVSRDASCVVARDDAQFQKRKTIVAQPPLALRFDFAGTEALRIVSQTYDYAHGHPQKEHFAAVCEGARRAGERVSIVSVLRPAETSGPIDVESKPGEARVPSAAGVMILRHE